MKKWKSSGAEKTLTLETGRVARQADARLLATLARRWAVRVDRRRSSRGQDFFPLTVHYQEKYSAAGRIPGGFFKRERGATEKETLTSRLIDRPIRPLFPEGFYNEINVIAHVLSYDGENEPDILALVAASAALTISGVPFMGPIAAARIGYQGGEYQLNPSMDQIREGELDLVVAGTHDAVMMVESEAKELSEDVMLGAVMFAHRELQPVIDAIISLAEQAAKDPWELAPVEDQSAAKKRLKDLIGKDLEAAYKLTNKSERQNAVNDARTKAREALADLQHSDPAQYLGTLKLVKKLEADIVRGAILKDGRRIDGRDTRTVRPIEAMVGFLPRTHGSALFTRGETQAICTTTLGTKDSEQMIDGLTGLTYERFMLHYNFPPYSVGEVGRFAPRRAATWAMASWPGARSRRAADADEFPTRSASSPTSREHGHPRWRRLRRLAREMDAGALRAPVSGTPWADPGGQGLRGDQRSWATRIYRRHGLKVAGNRTDHVLQMTSRARQHKEFMRQALAKRTRAAPNPGRDARRSTIREGVSAHAPRIETMQIDKARSAM